MSARVPVAVQIALNNRTVPSETRFCGVGAYVVSIATAVPVAEAPLEVHSTYTGNGRTETIAVHLLLGRGWANTRCATHDARQIPVLSARDRCLIDHLQVFQDLALELGHEARIDIEEALEELRPRLAAAAAVNPAPSNAGVPRHLSK